MSVNLGSFAFTVTAETSAAQRSLQQLVQAAQQAGRQVQGAFAASASRPDTRAAEQALNQLGAAAQRVQQRVGTITIRANLNEAEDALDRLTEQARELGDARLNLRVDTSQARTAEAAITRLSTALRAARAGERINVDVRAASVQEADAAIRRLTADINAAKAAGARVNVNVQTSQQGRGFLGEVGRGFLQQATPGLATGFAAAAGVVAAQATVGLAGALRDATVAGLEYNAMLETSAVQMRVFLGSTEAATEGLERLRTFADVTPFNTDEVIRSGAVFARVSGGNIQRMEQLVRLAGQLAAVNPNPALGGGLEGATIALREALAGDFTSIRERFNVSASEIQRLRDVGLAGEELAVALVKAAGGSQELVDAMGSTFTGRLSTAQSLLARIGGAATGPLFDALSAGLAKFNAVVSASLPNLERFARVMGVLAPSIVAGAVPGVGAGLGAVTAAIARAPAPTRPGALSGAEQFRQARLGAAADEAAAAVGAANRQEQAVKRIEVQLERNAQAARLVTAEYNAALRPLQAQSQAIDARIRVNAAEGRAIEARARQAQGPVETRAEVAGTAVVLEHEQELLQIRHRRAELAEQIGDAEQAIAQRVAEAQIRAAEQALRAAQDVAREQQQARVDALDALREEIRGRQELRQEALDGLRDLISAQQEQRRDAIEGVQDEIRARREAYDDARAATDELRRAARESQDDAFRADDRNHRSVMDHYRDQIEALRDQARERKGISDAERELAALDREDRARSRNERLQDARIAIGRASTGRELRDAALRFQRVQAETASDEKRETLQARIAKEKEREEQRRERLAEKIDALERKARDEDRAYQREREDREDQRREEDRTAAQQIRDEERAERERRKTEDQQLRELQRADRDATKAEQATIRDQERADRAADKAEAATIRAEEKAARDADRAAEAAIREQERGIQAARDALGDQQAAAATARDLDRLGRLREAAGIEEAILANRERGLSAVDVRQAAQAAADRIRNADQAAVLSDERARVDDLIATIETARDRRLTALADEQLALTIAKSAAEEYATFLERAADAAQKVVDALEQTSTSVAINVPLGGALAEQPLSDITGAGGSGFFAAGQQLAADIIAGISAGLTAGATGQDPFTTWAGEQIAVLFGAWESQSPSQVTYRLGTDIGAGLVQGLADAQSSVTAAFAALFDQVWAQGGAAAVDAVLTEVIVRFGGSETYSLPPLLVEQAPQVGAAIGALFDQAWAQGGAAAVDTVMIEVGNHWATVGEQIDSPRNRQTVERAISDLFGPNVLNSAFADVGRNMEIYGNNMAVDFQNGWTFAMQDWQPYVPAVGGGGGGGGGGLTPGPQDIRRYLIQNGWSEDDPEWDDVWRDFARQLASGRPPPVDMIVTGRRFGGPYTAGNPYLLHRDEIMVPGSSGSVLPPEFLRGVQAMAGGATGSGSTSVTVNIGHGAVQISGAAEAGLDQAALDAFGRRVLEDFSSVLYAARQHTSSRVHQLMPGAR